MYLHTMVQVSGHVFVYYGSSKRSCICVLKVSPLSLSTMFLLDFENVRTVWYFLFSF